jgi:hypothetical protein
MIASIDEMTLPGDAQFAGGYDAIYNAKTF